MAYDQVRFVRLIFVCDVLGQLCLAAALELVRVRRGVSTVQIAQQTGDILLLVAATTERIVCGTVVAPARCHSTLLAQRQQ